MAASISNNICLNCEKYGHHHYQCKIPILSVGIIAFTKNSEGEIKYLMIRRRHTLGFVDFIRGKYSIYNKEYILNLFFQMTKKEKEFLLTKEFSELWNYLWNKENANQYHLEQLNSKDKFSALKCGITNLQDNTYTLESLINESNENSNWEEPEWGFPKGRKNYNEKDLDGALREFTEETGYSSKQLKIVENIVPFEEIFMGSNYKSYKHRYFMMMMQNNNITNETIENSNNIEVSKIEWKTFEQCIESIRPYNLEKIRMITNIHKCFQQLKIVNK